ncbi:D-aminoacyl-tRNA deacylase [Aliifodinibius sp. S!AR15-10]|uniref:D-aminoacyl-tRNA deacylase n=1 Tax=Aliifodinibius sp. S!AR15-10 TaxID=2950437 RepID=UPI00285C2A3B|nr:D-aminoacyl-tRNA deacylase [Aliifodinibius sp. S!AR15-10]MDR8391316.1 D-aminoacyl-tRNA deacylase [Aliifodinibius sp. S!AR15-10]
MRVVVQRVRHAKVEVDNKETGSIQNGLLLLVGIHEEDSEEELEWMCEKILKLRIFDDESGKMNDSVQHVGGELLVVSQFTLYGDAEKGNRPSYIKAAGPDKAEELYEKMISYFKEHSDVNVETGVFGAYMDVELLNDGPVTIILDR